MTERDYGIDCYIELVSQDKRLTGEIAFVQMKTTAAIEWRKSDVGYKIYEVDRKTTNYLRNFKIPTYLFLVDLSTREMFFLSVKEFVQEHYNEYFEKTGEMHFTPPVQTIYAAIQALKEYFEEGEDAKFARHHAVYEAIHKGLDELGLETVVDPAIESGLVVSVKYPDEPNWDFEKVHDYCYERGFTIYPGKISTTNTFRLCSLGKIYPKDIEDFMVVLREALNY